MATPMNTPLTEEIRQLSSEDLFATLPERSRLGGAGPFVINLIASTVPISVPKPNFVEGCSASLYQIQRLEDRRMRYRLRLGPFLTEDQADATLTKVRDLYPGALTATADADDRRAITTLEAKLAQTATAAEPLPAREQTAPLDLPALVKQARSPEQTAVAEYSAVSVPTAPQEFPPTLPISSQVAPKTPPVPRRAPITHPVALAVPHPQKAGARGLNLDSTRTIRALCAQELEGEDVLRWFVIQLELSEDAFDPETVPDLDIFSVYRLYSVAGIDQGKILHALRVGFFTEEIAARAVADYLGSFYDKPSVKRVSVAERERFANQPLEPRKDVGATGKQAVIEITDERYVRERRSIVRGAGGNEVA